MKEFFEDRWGFITAVVAAVVIKFLLDSEPPPPDEEPLHRTYRRRKEAGGIMAGAFCGLLAPDWIINRVEWLSADDRLMLGVGMALLGDHAFKAFIQRGPEILQALARRLLPKKEGE